MNTSEIVITEEVEIVDTDNIELEAGANCCTIAQFSE